MFLSKALLVGILVVYFTSPKKLGMFFSSFTLLLSHTMPIKRENRCSPVFPIFRKNLNVLSNSKSICSKTGDRTRIKLKTSLVFSVVYFKLIVKNKQARKITVEKREDIMFVGVFLS